MLFANDLYRHIHTHNAYVCEFMACFIPYLKSTNVQGKPQRKLQLGFHWALKKWERKSA